MLIYLKLSNKKEIKKIILFTDIKDYTLKTSLLTSEEINELLDIHEDIVKKYVTKYNGEVVKSIGDSFMIVYDDIINSIKASIEIQEFFERYNKTKNIYLNKIELKIGIAYGLVNQKESLKHNDYFGDTVNLASRILSKTPANNIFISDNIYKEIKNKFTGYSLGKSQLKGIIGKTEVYHILYKEDEIKLFNEGNFEKLNIDFIKQSKFNEERNREIDELIHKVSGVGAIISLQPIPLLDITNMLPFQIYIVRKIAQKYNLKLTIQDSKDIIGTLIASLGGSYIIGQGIIGLAKIGLPLIGGYVIMPLNYSLIYGFGKITNVYLYHKVNGIDISNKRLKQLFKEYKTKGKEIGEKEKEELKEATIEKTNHMIEEVNEIKKEIEEATKEGIEKAKAGAEKAKEQAIHLRENAEKIKLEAIKIKDNANNIRDSLTKKIKKED